MDDFALGLILAEENRRLASEGLDTAASGGGKGELQEETYTYEDTDVVYDKQFDTPPQYVQDDIDGPGTINQFSVYAASPNFEVLVDIDGSEFVFDHFTDLQSRSTMMHKVNARERDGGYFFSIEDLDYNDTALFRVYPKEKIMFNQVRLSADLWRPVEG